MSFKNKDLPVDQFSNIMVENLNEIVCEEFNLTAQSKKENISNYDIILTNKAPLNKIDKRIKTNRQQYEIASFQFTEDLNMMVEIIKEIYPEFYDFAIMYLEKYHIDIFVICL